MNRAQRRAAGIPSGSIEEQKRVRLAVKGDVVYLEMIGMTSGVTNHAAMSAKMGFALAWAFIKTSYKAWTHYGKWNAIKSMF